ncbi:hypothetical protein HQ520_05165 [bacterium]|nr:hypothetical protein [bacterium]
MNVDASGSPADTLFPALKKLGWQPVPPGLRPLPRVLALSGAPECLPLVFLQLNDHRLAVFDLTSLRTQPAPPETPASLFTRYLDLSLCDRLALWTVQSQGDVDLLLSLTPEGWSLYDVSDEILLGRCGLQPDPEELSHCLRALEPGALGKRALPDPERLGAELGRWFNLFCGAMGPALRWSKKDAERLGRQLLLGLKAILLSPQSEHCENLGKLGFTCAQENDRLSVKWVPAPVPDMVACLLSAAQTWAPKATGAFSPLEQSGLKRQLEQIGDTRNLPVADALRLSAIRFHTSIQLAILLPTDQEHAAWRLALMAPLRVHSEIEFSDLYVFKPLLLDLGECGCGRVLEAVHKLALHAIAQNQEIGHAGGAQLDMVENVAGEDPAQMMRDPFNWVCRHALRLKVAPQYQEALAFLVASHLLELRNQPPFDRYLVRSLDDLPRLFDRTLAP